MTRYAVTYHWVDGCIVDPAYLDQCSADGPSELIDVTDACVGWHCTADLWLANGERAGWVHADGSYKLAAPGEPCEGRR